MDKCGGCHSAKKQKGGLRMDGKEWILKGGKDGLVFVSGNATLGNAVRSDSVCLGGIQRWCESSATLGRRQRRGYPSEDVPGEYRFPRNAEIRRFDHGQAGVLQATRSDVVALLRFRTTTVCTASSAPLATALQMDAFSTQGAMSIRAALFRRVQLEVDVHFVIVAADQT